MKCVNCGKELAIPYKTIEDDRFVGGARRGFYLQKRATKCWCQECWEAALALNEKSRKAFEAENNKLRKGGHMVKRDRIGSDFKRGSGCFQCNICGKLTRDTGNGNGDCHLCPKCFEREGLVNEHNGGGHARQPHPGCPLCRV